VAHFVPRPARAGAGAAGAGGAGELHDVLREVQGGEFLQEAQGELFALPSEQGGDCAGGVLRIASKQAKSSS